MHRRPLCLPLIVPLLFALPIRLGTTPEAQVSSAGSHVADLVDPRHTALIVHEMMNDFISPGGEYDKQGRRYRPELMASLIPRMQELLAAGRRKNVRVIYVHFTSHEDGTTLSDANRRDVLSGREAPERLHIEGSWGWEIIDALKPQPQDLVLRKYRPDAFYGTILDSILRWNSIKTVITTGVGVAVGGVPTVMTAMNLGYQSIAVGDAFISTDDKRTSAALDYLRAHAIVRSHREIVDAWDRSAPRPTGIEMKGPATDNVVPDRAMHEGREIPVSREELLAAHHTAVMIHDMQNDFVSPRGACAGRPCGYDRARVLEILPRVQRVLRTARARGALVIFLQSTNADDDEVPSSTWPPSNSLREGTWGWRPVDMLNPQRGDIVIQKYRPDGFHGTRLDDVLRRHGIKTLVLAGINADDGGLQTLMRGWYIGYYRVVLSDAVLSNGRAGGFGQGMLDMAMPVTHEELVKIWTRP